MAGFEGQLFLHVSHRERGTEDLRCQASAEHEWATSEQGAIAGRDTEQDGALHIFITASCRYLSMNKSIRHAEMVWAWL